MELISVIIPVYNVEKYLKQCLDSIVQQTYSNLEILLIDDGSTDGSGMICDQYEREDSRIRVFHKKNAGVSVARNYGLEQAKGTWILFVDSDDWISVNTISYAWNAIGETDDICFIGYTKTEEDGQKTIPVNPENVKRVVVEKADFLGLEFQILNRDRDTVCDREKIKLSSPCKLYRRSLIENNHIRFPEQLPNGEDGVFNLYAYRYARRGVALENELYYYRQRGDSVTRKYTPFVERDFRRLHQEYEKFIWTEEKPEVFSEVMDERKIWSLSFCCILKYCHPDCKESYQVRKRWFLKELQEEYQTEVSRVKLGSFGLQKKIMFWSIKQKWFGLICILCYLNNRKK